MSDNYYKEQLPVYDYGIKEFVVLIWKKKLLVFSVTFVFALISVFYSLSLENTYKSDVLLESARNSDNSLGQSAAQLGQLATFAGLSIPGAGNDSIAVDLAMLESRTFLSSFINENNLLIPLFSAYQWDVNSKELLLDSEIYDSEAKRWTRKVKSPYNAKPSVIEAVDKFKENLELQHDVMNGMITISYEFYSPLFTKQLLERLILQFNAYVKTKEIAVIKKNINYLEKQAQLLNNAGMKNVFYSLLEEQQKKIMLASSSNEYVFRVIDPAITPERKFGPKRALICVLGTLAGFFLSIFFILMRQFFKG